MILTKIKDYHDTLQRLKINMILTQIKNYLQRLKINMILTKIKD